MQWHIGVINLVIHRSGSLVRHVTAESNLVRNLDVKFKYGILAIRQSRTAFLPDPTHRIVFHHTPRHCSWMHQIEIWLVFWCGSCWTRIVHLINRSE